MSRKVSQVDDKIVNLLVEAVQRTMNQLTGENIRMIEVLERNIPLTDSSGASWLRDSAEYTEEVIGKFSEPINGYSLRSVDIRLARYSGTGLNIVMMVRGALAQ